jgi:hypothetical protein
VISGFLDEISSIYSPVRSGFVYFLYLHRSLQQGGNDRCRVPDANLFDIIESL